MEFINDEVLEGVKDESEVLERIIESLENEPFNCEYPRLAIEMIKRKIRVGGKDLITREQITKWGNRGRKLA